MTKATAFADPAKAAAFGRLCVETRNMSSRKVVMIAAAFGRLCVETNKVKLIHYPALQPPSGGCVLKLQDGSEKALNSYAAAFGRLCVETQKTVRNPRRV